MPGLRRRATTSLVSALALIPQIAPPALADTASQESQPSPACEQWVVTLKGDFASAFDAAITAGDVATSVGATVSASVPRLHAYLLDACDEHTKQLLAARADSRIALAFPNVRVTPAASTQQWYLHNVGQPYYVGSSSGVAVTNEQARAAGLDFAPAIAGKDIKWQEALAKFPALRGNGVTVGVVDTGVDATVPELAGRVTAASASVNCDLDLAPIQPDLEGHGTAVAGLIAADGANGGLTGVAPDARILAVQPDCDTADGQYGGVLEFALGVLYASQNAQVINLSNGINPAGFADYGGPGTASSLYIQALQLYKSAIDEAIANGTVIVASSGNGGGGDQIDRGILPGDYRFPASFPSVTSVGSTRSDGTISSFSQWNDQVDVAAPGESVLTLRSSYVLNCGEVGEYWCFVNLNGTGGAGAPYWVQDGTSFSTPLVSGAAALAKQKWPRLTSTEFEQLVRDTADDGGAAGYDTHFGAGTVNLERLLSFNFAPEITATTVIGAAVPGSELRLRAQVENLEGDSDITGVTADLSPLGLAPVTFSNSAPGIYESGSVTIPPETPIGSYTTHVTVQDAGGAQVNADLQIQVFATVPPQQIAPGVTGPSTTSIEIIGPERGRDFATNESSVTLTGTASSDIAVIEVNGQSIPYSAGSTTWSAEVNLTDGENVFSVHGYDLARSKDASDEVTIDLDQDAPDRVRDLNASGNVLSWTAPKAHDVEGYTIYQLTGKKAKRVGATRKREYTVKAAGTYVVIAEDRAGNAIAPKKGSPVVVGASSSPSAFVDVPATHFARAAVDALAARGVVQRGTFFWPERAMTRAEFAKLLVLSVRKEASARPSSTLADVASTHPLATYIAIAVREGWAHGADGRFYPDRAITRGEAALMLVRARGLSFNNAQPFPDTEGVMGAAAGALRDRGIVTGVNGRFAPNQPLLRGEAAKMIASQ